MEWYDLFKKAEMEQEDEIITFLIATKLDICTKHPSRRKIDYQEALAFAKENGFEYYETSAFENINSSIVYEKLIYKIHTDRNPIRSVDGEI